MQVEPSIFVVEIENTASIEQHSQHRGEENDTDNDERNHNRNRVENNANRSLLRLWRYKTSVVSNLILCHAILTSL